MTETSYLLFWPILVLGAFNCFWVSLANYFGKRLIFVFASLLLLVSYVWGTLASSFKSPLWSNIVAAFAGSSTEALGAAIASVSAHSCWVFPRSHDPLPDIRNRRATHEMV
jgi:hypothetical protein